MSLFTPSAPWTTAASHLNVFKIYPQWIDFATDSDLQTQFADLNRRGIALALEFGPITASSQCGIGVEGSSGETLLAAAQRIQRDGGTLRYLAMDEPIYYFTLYNGQNFCQWTVDQMAVNAAVNVHALLAQFPNVIVGDIEPVPVSAPNWLTQYQAGVEAFRRAFGFPLAFFEADVYWGSPSYFPAVSSLHSMLVREGVPFGIIYKGNASDVTDAGWIQSASEHMDFAELNLGSPDFVIFQSWNPYPKKLLPETDSDSFTYLIDTYFRRRTLLTLTSYNTTAPLQGTLTAADNGQPIASVPVNLSLSGTSGSGMPAVYTLSGNVPSGTQSIVFGARVNMECACSGTTNLLVSSFTFNAGASGVITRDFSHQLNGWGVSSWGSPAPTVQIQGTSLQILAQPGQSVYLSSSAIPLSAAVPYTLSVNAQVAPESSGSGYFTAIFLDSSSAEITRVGIVFAPATLSGSTATDSLGRFSIPLPYTGPDGFQVMATYAGSNDYWPAQSLALQTWPATLNISETHSGNFSLGQNGAICTVNVSNSAGSATASGVVNVDATIPAGLTLASMSGNGWTCPGGTRCTRTDPLIGGASYPPITMTVNVASNATSPQVNRATVSGGGSVMAGASDSTTLVSSSSLTIAKTHTGSFTQGQQSATYTVTVANAGGAPQTGTVSVTDTLPTGLTLVSVTGAGWSCVSATCTRNDILMPGGSYPPITVAVNVSSTAPSSVTNVAVVSGGTSTPSSASDVTNIGSPAIYTLSGSVTVAGAGMSGVNLSLTGTSSGSTVTNASGSYTFGVLSSGGTYTLSASRTGYSFNAPVTFSNLSANQTANFTGFAVTNNCVGMFLSTTDAVCSALSQSNLAVSVGAPATYYGAMTLIGNVPNGDAAGMALYNVGGGAGASVSLDLYNTPLNGGIPQAKIKALDDGAYSDNLTFWTKNPGGPNNPVIERLRISSNGNVGIGANNPNQGPLQMGSGAFVSTGGVWTNASDRNLKENFLAIEPAAILQKIRSLPLTEWNYKNEVPSVRHIGPVAQEFYSIFGVGNSSTSISTIDASGIALAGIQGLAQRSQARAAKLAELKKQLETREEEIRSLEERLAQLESLIERIAPATR